MNLDAILTPLTIPALVTVAASGVAFALVVWHLRPLTSAEVSRLIFLLAIAGILWLLPQVVQRDLDPQSAPGYAGRTFGALILFLIGFAPAVHITLRLLARKP